MKYKDSKGREHWLNHKIVTLRDGSTQPLYYFSRDYRETTSCDMPGGYEVFESQRTNMPFLRRV